MTKKHEWIFLKYDVQPNLMICERCGEKVLAPMPCKISTAIEMFKGFAKAHKKCKERR